MSRVSVVQMSMKLARTTEGPEAIDYLARVAEQVEEHEEEAEEEYRAAAPRHLPQGYPAADEGEDEEGGEHGRPGDRRSEDEEEGRDEEHPSQLYQGIEPIQVRAAIGVDQAMLGLHLSLPMVERCNAPRKSSVLRNDPRTSPPSFSYRASSS